MATIDRDGVTQSRPGVRKRHPWSRVRRVVRERRGLLLSPFESRRWLEERRGIYLRFVGNEAAVRDAVAAHVAANEGAS